MNPLFALSALVAVLAACGPKAGISETRMAYAPPRNPNCTLQLVQVDYTSPQFSQTWEVLGYITFRDRGTQDPMAEQNRALARPRACKMGGTSIAVAMNTTNTNVFGWQGSGLVYMVLRPKPAGTPAPTAF